MKLDEFFQKIAPMFDGRASVDEVAVALYGSAKGHDADRLRVYESMCRWRRGDTLAWTFPRCRAYVLEHGGLFVWETIASDYFIIDPWRSLNPLPNTGMFPAFLIEHEKKFSLPGWLPQVADLEWWFASIRCAPDDPSDPNTGSLRLHPLVELRPYDYDLAAWIEDKEENKREGPAQKRSAVLIWRNRKLGVAIDSVGKMRIRLLGAVQGDAPLDAALAADIGVGVPEMCDAVRVMWQRGILIGDLREAFARGGHQLMPLSTDNEE